jgi:UDP-N-acetylglucosamine--N-acetylmuramyl-(pentapeptide) pyrophosphoryl-undecaprenol N-acetylglucosamine transferase
MKIILAGGGTGGHFYPLIAVAEELNKIIDENNIANAKLYFLSDTEFDSAILYENRITYKKVNAGKLRRTLSPRIIIDGLKAVVGLFQAFWVVFSIFPDVVFTKGGYSAFPTVFAARLLRIPIIVHESDSIPGRVNVWSSKFAQAVAVSYKQAAEYFPKGTNIIHTGQPVRNGLHEVIKEGAHEFLELERGLPTILILGGSQGAQKINSVILDSLPVLLEKYQIIHQVGSKNYEEVTKMVEGNLIDNVHRYRYHPHDFLNILEMKMAAAVTDLVITRAGSTLFEVAEWELPAIVIPYPHAHKDHQTENAYNYARAGAGIVIEENNLSDDLLISEIDRIYSDTETRDGLIEGARAFRSHKAEKIIAEEIAALALKHEK